MRYGLADHPQEGCRMVRPWTREVKVSRVFKLTLVHECLDSQIPERAERPGDVFTWVLAPGT